MRFRFDALRRRVKESNSLTFLDILEEIGTHPREIQLGHAFDINNMSRNEIKQEFEKLLKSKYNTSNISILELGEFYVKLILDFENVEDELLCMAEYNPKFPKSAVEDVLYLPATIENLKEHRLILVHALGWNDVFQGESNLIDYQRTM